MSSNILKAIKNLVENPVINLTAHYSGRNRINGVGNALETYIKDLFANTFEYDNEYSKLPIYNEVFSYSGNQNNPPDIVLRNGDAIEVKKVQSSSIDLQLNSSFPKSKLFADSLMINEHCRNCEQWDEKDILYAVGQTTDTNLKELWFVYGDCIAADKEVYMRIKNTIIRGLHSIPNIELAETRELGRLNKVDPLGVTSLRVRGMWTMAQPQKIFNYIPKQNINANFKFYCIMKSEKFEQFPADDKISIQHLCNNYSFYMRDLSIKNPNNPVHLIPVKFLEFYYG